MLARAEVAQNAEGIPYLPKIEDHSGASNVNITPKAAVKEVKDAKPGQFPKVGLRQLMGYLNNASKDR